MKPIIVIFFGILVLGIAFVVVKHDARKENSAAYTIGILQTASHPALDAAREGFVEELKNKMGDSVAFIVQNAQGSVAQAHGIAQQLHADKQISGFFVIATPAAQAMSAVEKVRPIILAAVTDPHSLGLINPTTNVCGTKDMIDVQAEIDALVGLVPQAKNIGILYTSGEANSIALVKKMREEIVGRSLNSIDFALSNEADVHAVMDVACRKADVILAPTDNTVASTITAIAAIALKYKKPLIVSDNMLVKNGALAARGVDYRTSGKRAAQIAYEVIVEGKKPYNLPVEQAASEQIVVNKETLATLGLSVPSAMQEHVVYAS